MSIKEFYEKTRNPHCFAGHQEYHVPAEYLDPKKIMIDRQMAAANKLNIYRRFKPEPSTKPSFVDEGVKLYSNLPSPDKYNTSKNILRKYNSLQSLQKVSPNISRNTLFDEINKNAKRIRAPSVGSYNLLTVSDFRFNKTSRLAKHKQAQRRYLIDNVQCLSSEVPGPGFYNPHKLVQKLKVNPMNPLLSRRKSESILDKSLKKQKTGVNPFSYSPVIDKTFAKTMYNSKQKIKMNSSFKEIKIPKRKGIRSLMKEPGPNTYSLICQWGKNNKPTEQNFGKVNILNKITSQRSLSHSIYHS